MCQSRLDNILITVFCPSFRHSFRRPDFIEDVIRQTGDDKPAEEIDAINVSCANGDSLTDCACETDDVDDNAKNVSDLL
jgi:hypothetical protein